LNSALFGRLAAGLTVALLTILIAGSVAAQEPKPAKPAKAAKPAAAKPARPAGTPAASKPKPAAKPAAAVPEPSEVTEMPAAVDPAVEAILDTKPSTPSELVRAAKILAQLNRPDLAKDLLQKLLATKPDGAQLGALVQQFGTEVFTGMAARPELAPVAGQLADAVLAVAARQAEDPQRLAALVAKLQDPAADVRAQAMVGLQRGGVAAVTPLLAVLANDQPTPAQSAAGAALVQLGADAVDPLVAALEAPDQALVARVLQVLAAMNKRDLALWMQAPWAAPSSPADLRRAAQQAMLRLCGATPTPADAAALLAQKARGYLEGREPLALLPDGSVLFWRWDATKKQSLSQKLAADTASRAMAARLARDAYRIAPDDREIRTLYLLASLEAAAYEQGLDRPLAADHPAVAELARIDVDALEQVLSAGMRDRYPAAAAVAARVLGVRGVAPRLLYQGSHVAPLVIAARHADPRLRIAAIEAIVGLQPARPYSGSSFLPEAISYFAASSGRRRVLVGSPHAEDALQMAGSLLAAGYVIDTATDGHELVRKAAASPDYELALIDMTLDKPTAEFVVQQLRHDYRSAELRVGLIARDGFLPRAELIAGTDKLTLAFSRPHTAEELAWQVGQLARLAPRQFVPYAVRQQQARQAMEWMAQLSTQWPRLYDVYRFQDALLAALHVAPLAPQAIGVVQRLGTPECQRGLVELASQPAEPLAVREAAVKAFRQNAARFGILLSSAEIVRQYARYNQSESADRGTQRVLGAILDCVESPRRARSGSPAGPTGKSADHHGT
jgi:CheY-like chemotaxis protein